MSHDERITALEESGGGSQNGMPTNIFTVCNEVAKVMFLQVSVHRGVVSQHALQVVSQHALQQVSRECLVPGGCLVGGCLVPGVGGCLLWGDACSRGDVVETPPPASRQLLLQTVRILLESIVVQTIVSTFIQNILHISSLVVLLIFLH